MAKQNTLDFSAYGDPIDAQDSVQTPALPNAVPASTTDFSAYGNPVAQDSGNPNDYWGIPNTWQTGGEAIKAEAQKTAAGGQPWLVGAGKSMAHAGGVVGGTLGDILFNNPLSQGIMQGVGNMAADFGRLSPYQFMGGVPDSTTGQIPEQPATQSDLERGVRRAIQDDPTVGYSLGTAANLANLLGLEKLPAELLKGMGKGVSEAAVRNTARSIALKEADIKAGADIANIAKYGLVGEKPETFAAKAKAMVSDAANKLKQHFSNLSTADISGENKVSLNDALQGALKKGTDVEGGTATLTPLLLKKEYENVLAELTERYKEFPDIMANGEMNLSQAQELKQKIGAMADWNQYSNHPNASQAQGQLLNDIYENLRVQLENKGGAEVKQLNQTMSDLIPLQRAAYKKALVASRAKPVGLSDFLALATAPSSGGLSLVPGFVNWAAASPKVTKATYGLGNLMQYVGEGLNPSVSVPLRDQITSTASGLTAAGKKLKDFIK